MFSDYSIHRNANLSKAGISLLGVNSPICVKQSELNRIRETTIIKSPQYYEREKNLADERNAILYKVNTR